MGNKTGKNLVSKFWKRSKTSSIEQINLETFLLVWLDPNVNTIDENRTTQIRLRNILTYLVTFDNIESCETWLKKYDNDEKIVLIVSGAYGEKLVPKIHYLPSIISIYVYCLDVNRNTPWSKNYSKIRDVISNTEILLEKLSMNQTNLESVEDSKALEIYSSDMKIASYIWYQLLLEILLSPDYLSSNNTSDEFLQILREYSSYDQYGLNLISQFERTYDPKHAVSWLMNDTLLARFLNKVLRERDINLLFILRFLLVDIHQQIIKYQADSLDVFRIQPMTKSQMESLLANSGQLLVINGFLFASTNKPQLMSTMTNDDQYETVLINIKANYRSGVAPFAFLRDMDSNIEEQVDREILFMCGSIFLVGPLVYEESIWTLQLTLISDHDVPELFEMKQQLKKTRNLFMIGDLLNHCEQSDQAIVYYERLHSELPKQHILIPEIDKQLSIISKSDSSQSNRYILINLSSHMTAFASAMLVTLRSLTLDEIYVHNDEITLDFSKWSDQSILLFTTAQFAMSLKDLPKSFTVFILDTDDSKINEQYRYATIEDLISQLADEIVRKYRLDAYGYHKRDELTKAKELEDKANKIYRDLLEIQTKFTTNTILNKTSNDFKPSLILLIPNNEDITTIKNYFDDFFSSNYSFYNEHQCHQHIVEHENTDEVFLIILTDYQSSITTNFRQFSNVKYVYSYGKLKNKKERIFPIRDDLYYQLTLDLIRYYAELGDEYEMNNQRKIAREIFLKGQKLCQFLNENFFSKKH